MGTDSHSLLMKVKSEEYLEKRGFPGMDHGDEALLYPGGQKSFL